MRKVPFEVAVAVCIRSVDPVGVDAEQLRQKQCSAAPPDDSTDQARGTDHEKRLAQSVACRRDAIGASSAPDERSRHSFSQDLARSRSDCLGDLGWPSLWSAGGGMARQFSDRGRPDPVHFVFRERHRVRCSRSLFGVRRHRPGDDFLCCLRAFGSADLMVDRRRDRDRHLVSGRGATMAVGLVDGARCDCGRRCARVVGVLIEVPLMLAVVRIVNGSKRWYESGASRYCASQSKT